MFTEIMAYVLIIVMTVILFTSVPAAYILIHIKLFRYSRLDEGFGGWLFDGPYIDPAVNPCGLLFFDCTLSVFICIKINIPYPIGILLTVIYYVVIYLYLKRKKEDKEHREEFLEKLEELEYKDDDE